MLQNHCFFLKVNNWNTGMGSNLHGLHAIEYPFWDVFKSHTFYEINNAWIMKTQYSEHLWVLLKKNYTNTPPIIFLCHRQILDVDNAIFKIYFLRFQMNAQSDDTWRANCSWICCQSHPVYEMYTNRIHFMRWTMHE